jgi:hypothetical protein
MTREGEQRSETVLAMQCGTRLRVGMRMAPACNMLQARVELERNGATVWAVLCIMGAGVGSGR